MISVSGILLIALGLSGCDSSGQPREVSRAGAGLELADPVSARAVERDIPAPEVFSATESGLWDGRPSLGGVWVAHPDVREPERALIRNERTGTEVIGALFRRERENPGPRFQISSEAAEALGILAGQPAEVAVTALRIQRIEPRRDTAAPPPADEVAAETAGVAPLTTAAAASAPLLTAEPDAAPAEETQALAAAEPAPRRSLREMFRRQPSDAAAPSPDTAFAPTDTAAAPAEPMPLAPATGQVEITELDPQPQPRRGLRDAFRRRAPEPQAEPGITETALAPTAPLAEPAAPTPAPTPLPVVAAPMPTGDAPLAGTAFLAEHGSDRRIRPARTPQPHAEPALLEPASAPGTESFAAPAERRSLRDMFRRRPAEQPADQTALIPLPDLDTASTDQL